MKTRVGKLTREEAHAWLFRGPLPIKEIGNIVTEYASFEGVRLANIKFDGFGVPVRMLPDGRLVSQRPDHIMDIWKDGKNTHSLKARGLACILLPNNMFASASVYDQVRVFDLATQACVWVLHDEDGFSRPVNLIALPHNVVASCHDDGAIRIWSTDTGARLMTLREHYKVVCALASLSNGLLASGSHDDTVRIWDISRERCVRVLTGHENSVRGLAALPDGRLASCGDDWTVRIWNTNNGDCEHVLEGHRHCVVGMAVLFDGHLVSAAYDHTFRVWDTDSRSCVLTCDYQCKGGIKSMAALPNCQLAIVYYNGNIDIWG